MEAPFCSFMGLDFRHLGFLHFFFYFFRFLLLSGSRCQYNVHPSSVHRRLSLDRGGFGYRIRHSLQQWSRHTGPITDGESWAMFGERIQAGVAALCEGLDRDANVLIVTSGGVIGRYTAEVLGAGADAAIQLNLQTRNTGVTEIVRTPSGGVRLVAFNAVPHLESADRQGLVTFS